MTSGIRRQFVQMQGISNPRLPVIPIMKLLSQCFSQFTFWKDLSFIQNSTHFFTQNVDEPDRVLAYISITKELLPSLETVYMIWNVCVDPLLRKQGLGESLIRHAMKEMIIPHAIQPHFGLYVKKDNVPAIKLYKKLGFSEFRDDGDKILMLHKITSVLFTFDFQPDVSIRSRKLINLLKPQRMTDCVANALETIGLITTQQERQRIGHNGVTSTEMVALLRRKKSKLIFRHNIGSIDSVRPFLETHLTENNKLLLLAYERPADDGHITTIGRINDQFVMIDFQHPSNIVQGMDNILSVINDTGHNRFYTFLINLDLDVRMKSTPQIIGSRINPLTQRKRKRTSPAGSSAGASGGASGRPIKRNRKKSSESP